ncbi:hypothetical protein [Herbiconiux sp. YIM B11900]|uniref:hypothetical protein n=1 Tax=Herbiconiux sp. YIM B11900 TaxID=3404131 RepID=UPI003F864130
MKNEHTDDVTSTDSSGVPRRTVIAAAAWAAPVIAVAAATPLAAASGQFPDAQSTAVLGNTSPNAGTSATYNFFSQVEDADGNYENGGSYKAGWYILIAGNGSGYASIGNLVGLVATSTPGRYLVTDEADFVRFRINGFTYTAAPGIVTATIYTPGGVSRGGIVIDVQQV